MSIGGAIRAIRLNKGLSQEDIRKRTGLLRYYLSRVENGHTTPSLETLTKLGSALDVPVADFFSDNFGLEEERPLPRLSKDDISLLRRIQFYATNLDENDRKLVLDMVRKMAETAT